MAKIDKHEYDEEVKKRVSELSRTLRTAYLGAIESIADLVVAVPNPSEPFEFAKHPELKDRVDAILRDLAAQVEANILNGVTLADGIAEDRMAHILEQVYIFGDGATVLSSEQMTRWFTQESTRAATLEFTNRKVKGLNLSERVWNLVQPVKTNIEVALEQGISKGISAAELSQEIRDALNQPNRLYRRVKQPDGSMALSKAAASYHPGQGVYRSSYKNALRLTSTEINMAYRSAFNDRIQSKNWITGKEIRLSNNHTAKGSDGKLIRGWRDICDDLAGVYPKDFVWIGWHPNCYSRDTEVLTKRGWLPLEDVNETDLIWSLNPETRLMEWVEICRLYAKPYEGDMYRFHNRTLDMLVTPDHPMLHLHKRNGSFQRRQASDFSSTIGAIARAGAFDGMSPTNIQLSHSLNLDFEAFCEYMGYWLADGSVARVAEVVIAQRKNDPNCERILKCIRALGFEPYQTKDKIYLYSHDFNSYLRKFGHSFDKYVPEIIKEATEWDIQIFLDAFISCDGHVRPPKAFMGNRGKMCTPKNGERCYFTSSPRLAADLGELILKVGKRPSYHTTKCAGKVQKFRNGEYAINHDSFRISECNALTATVFSKSVEHYNGWVFDIELERNHIMYLRRNGKCFWGSNCRCEQVIVYQDPTTAIREFAEGRSTAEQITQTPEAWGRWYADNKEKIDKQAKRGKLPYFVRDNNKYRK